MSEGRNTELVSGFRALLAKPITEVAAIMCSRGEISALLDALESTSRALSEKEGELAEANGKLTVRMDYLVGLATTADKHVVAVAESATRQRDEALAALKASEEREAKLIRKLASARLRPEPSSVPAAAIKPLKWDTDPLGNMMAVAACGWATVEVRSDGRWRWSLGGVAAGTERRKEDAVKMLTASYEARVCSALENGPADLADATKKDPGTEQREAGV